MKYYKKSIVDTVFSSIEPVLRVDFKGGLISNTLYAPV